MPLATRKREISEPIEEVAKKIRLDTTTRESRNSLDSISSISNASLTRSPSVERIEEVIIGTIDLRSNSGSLSPVGNKPTSTVNR